MFSAFVPFDGKSDFGKGFASFLGGRAGYLSWGVAPSFCVAKDA